MSGLAMMGAVAAEPGVYPGLPREEWPPGLSPSSAKDILAAPALYRWRRDHPTPPSEAMEVGTALHALVLEGSIRWAIIEGGRGVTERKAEARADGYIPVTVETAERIEAMAAAVADLPESAEVLRLAPEREVAAFAPDPESGVWLRGQIDALAPRFAVDLKTARAGVLNDFGRQAVNLGYDLQAAAYSAIFNWLGRPLDAFLFLVVESEPPYFVGVRELDADLIDRGRRRMRRAIDTYAACMESGDWPGPAPYAVVSAPGWALREE